MKNLLFISIAIASSAFSQTPLSSEQRLELENANLKLQILRIQESEINKKSAEVFKSACKSAEIPLAECKLDMLKGVLVREPSKQEAEKK
jgi:hypothetical protein